MREYALYYFTIHFSTATPLRLQRYKVMLIAIQFVLIVLGARLAWRLSRRLLSKEPWEAIPGPTPESWLTGE